MPNNELKIFFEPRKEFAEETRILFLSRLEISNKKEKVYIGGLFTFKPFLKYTLATVFVVIFLSGGLVIYADSKNVDINNPLYGFKKTGEKVRLVIAPKERKPIVNHQIAQRRLEEMHGLKNTDNKKMESLNKEYNEEINLSLDEMANLDNERLAQIKELCAKISQTISKKVKVAKAADIDDYTSANFDKHCGQFMPPPSLSIPVK